MPEAWWAKKSGRNRNGPNPGGSWCQLCKEVGFKYNGEAVLRREMAWSEFYFQQIPVAAKQRTA